MSKEIVPEGAREVEGTVLHLQDYKEQSVSRSEVVDRFISLALHPGLGGNSETVARYIVERLDERAPEGVTDDLLDQRRQLQDGAVVVWDLDSQEYDALEQTDLPFAMLNEALQLTKQKGVAMSDERRALRLLLDVRAGVVHRQEVTDAIDERWIRLIDVLSGCTERHMP